MNNRPSLEGLTTSLLATTGARKEQIVHLRHLGVKLAPEGPREITGRTYHQLASIDGIEVADMLAFKLALDHILTRGLWDNRNETVDRVGRHLRDQVTRGRPGDPLTSIDVVSLDLFAQKGVSPAWLLLLSALLDRCTLHLTGAALSDIIFSQPPYDEEPMLELSIHLGAGNRWTGEGVMLADGLPNGLTTAAIGLPLSRVVSHPILDQHDLIIREIHENGLLDVGHVPSRMIDWNAQTKV